MRSIWAVQRAGKRTATVPVKCRRKCKWQRSQGYPLWLEPENLYGSYVHGVFDAPGICETIATALAARKGITLEMAGQMDYIAYKEEQYDKLAEILRESLDMERYMRSWGWKRRCI